MPTLQFPDVNARLKYWSTHAPIGAPKTPVDEYLDYIESALPQETWEDFTARISGVRANYERAADVCKAIYDDSKFVLGTDDNGTRTGMDELLANAAPLWRGQPSTSLDTWLRWCKLASVFHFLPTGTDERSADFVWARARCFLAGAGYQAHSAISEELTDLYGGCPFNPTETQESWTQNLTKAHAACGWPAQLGWLPWTKLQGLLGSSDEFPPPWLKMLGLLHVIKHARVSPSQGVVVHHGGTSTILPEERTNAMATWNSARSSLLVALGSPGPRGKAKPTQGHVALQYVLGHMEVNHLLRKTSVADLPPNLLAGPWTMPVPDHSSFEGFHQTGLRISGLWAASNGKVLKESLGQSEVLDYDWNCKDPASKSVERKLFASGLPSTYTESWPSDVFLDAFPNLDLSWCPGLDLAIKVLLDVPVAASLLRKSRHEFLQEYPAIAFMPSNPSPTDSTNQGKSQACLVYARACNPAITRLVSINDSSSAPDIRTVAGEIRSTGSIAVDEFRPPKNATHIFAHDNMQALCTGSSVASGRVYENEGTVALRSSPVFSTKVYEVPPDIHNRSIAHWLGPLTDAMRQRSDILEQVRCGAVSLRMRLGMHAIFEKSNLQEMYTAAGRQSSSRGLRFDAHRTLAACIYSQRSGKTLQEAYAALDRACEMMQNKLRHHVQLAVDSGLVAAMEFGSALKLRMSYLFEDMSSDEFMRFRQTANVMAASRPGGVAAGLSAKDILMAWASLRGMEDRPLQELLQILTGAKRHVSNRAVIMALNASIHDLVPIIGAKWFLPGENGTVYGWIMTRMEGDLVTFSSVHPQAR